LKGFSVGVCKEVKVLTPNFYLISTQSMLDIPEERMPGMPLICYFLTGCLRRELFSKTFIIPTNEYVTIAATENKLFPDR
jgi:hypothetical protein